MRCRELCACTPWRFRVGADGHGRYVASTHEGEPQRFDTVIDVCAEFHLGDGEARGWGGVFVEVNVLADHVLGKFELALRVYGGGMMPGSTMVRSSEKLSRRLLLTKQ